MEFHVVQARGQPANGLKATPEGECSEPLPVEIPSGGSSRNLIPAIIVKRPKTAMTFASFLETYSLYRKATFERTFGQTDPLYSGHQAIHTYCDECRTDRTFNHESSPQLFHNKIPGRPNPLELISPEYSPFAGGHNSKTHKWDFIFYLCYRCSYCKHFECVYFIWSSADGKTLMKTGQFPSVDIAISKNLEQILHEHKENYKKGLICESQGFGIGAFSYFRRIVESIIDELLDSIESLLVGEEKVKFGKGLAETKKSIVAQQKIALVKGVFSTITGSIL